jgi:hypothetical protein
LVVGEVAVIAVEVFLKGVGEDFVHIDGDDFAVLLGVGHVAGKLRETGDRG